MAFSDKELQIIKASKANGLNRQQTEEALQNFRLGIKPNEKPASGLVFEGQRGNELQALGRIGLGVGKGLAETAIGTARLGQLAGQGIMAGILPNRTFSDIQEDFGFRSLQGEQAQRIDELLKAKTPEEKVGKGLAFTGELASGFISPLRRAFLKGSEFVGEKFAKEAITEGVQEGVELDGVSSGIAQRTKEFAQRFPRALERQKEKNLEAQARADLLKTATPAEKFAIDSNLDTRFITTIKGADEPTVQAYKDILNIVEDVGEGTLKPKQQPTIVAGNIATEQYDLIDQAKKSVGRQIGEAIDSLPNATIQMRPAFNQIDAVFGENGMPVVNGVIDFSQTAYTPQQREVIQRLYNLSRESGDVIDAKLVHAKDRLFATLNREARTEQIQPIYLKVNGEDTNLFGLFRDVYRNQLDNLDNGYIRGLNNEYRELATFVDDIERSIVKTGNFDTAQNADMAEFAKNNLKRISGEAQSTPAFQAIVEQMDTMSRTLGYEGARADDALYFALELRKLYRETIPTGGFTGGIQVGLSDVISKVSREGLPTVIDQKRAIKELLEEASGNPTSFNRGAIPNLTGVQKKEFDAFERDPILTGIDAEIQEASIAKYVANKEAMQNEFIETLARDTKNVVNTDEARKLFADVGYNGINSASVHEASSQLAKDVYLRLLKERSEPDALIFAGGSGTGKTSVAKTYLGDQINDASVILDGNLSSIKGANQRIQEAIDAGKTPRIVYVYREIDDAWVNGVIKRMLENEEEGGRVVPLSVFMKNHKGSYETVKELLQRDDVSVEIIDNSLGLGNQKAMKVDKFNSIEYTDEVREGLLARTKQLLEAGEITQEQYDGLIK